MAEHSRFGGSTADRWMNCAGSTALIATVPARPSSSYADEGSAAHHLAAVCLAKDQHPIDFLGQTFPEWPAHPVTEDMVDAVLVYLEAVTHELAKTKDAGLYVEQGFVLEVDNADPGEVFGTNDAMVYHPSTGRLVVFDYKHGVGVSVSAEDNAQLKFYATGAVFANPTWRLSELELVIVQPRARDADPDTKGVKRWTMNILELLKFQQDVDNAIGNAKHVERKMAAGVDYPEAFDAGSWCRWCDAASVCPAREKAILDATELDYANMTEITAPGLPDPRSLDVERLGRVLKAGELLNDWLRQVEEYVQALLLSGTKVPGWKLVDKIGRSRWTGDDADVVTYAGLMFGIDEDQIHPRKLTTLTEAEKLLKKAGATKADIDDFKLKFTIKESSGLTMAAASDRRPGVDAIAADFGSVSATLSSGD